MINIPEKITQPIDINELVSMNRVTGTSGYLVRMKAAREPAVSTFQTAKKGQKIFLSDLGSNIDNLNVVISWNTNSSAYDLDTECFMVDKQDRVVGDDWFVFYGSLESPDKSVIHNGDSSNGEVISIQLSKVDSKVQKLVIVLTINDAHKKGLNFSGVSDVRMTISDRNSGKCLLEFCLTDYYDAVISMVIGELYRHNGSWKFNAVGNGMAAGLLELCQRYGVNAQS